jgi:hypothetical protein
VFHTISASGDGGTTRSFISKSEFSLALDNHLDDMTSASHFPLAHLAITRQDALAIAGHINAAVETVVLRTADVANAAGGVTPESLLRNLGWSIADTGNMTFLVAIVACDGRTLRLFNRVSGLCPTVASVVALFAAILTGLGLRVLVIDSLCSPEDGSYMSGVPASGLVDLRAFAFPTARFFLTAKESLGLLSTSGESLTITHFDVSCCAKSSLAFLTFL